MAQRDLLIEVLKDFPDMTGTNQELIDSLGFKPASVRRLTGTLTLKGILERVDRGTYKLVGMYRHFISALFYCSGKKEFYYALTFSVSKKSLFNDLVQELESETIDKCSNAINPDTGKSAGDQEDYGYEVEFIEADDIEENYIYPEIKVGLEE